MPVRSGQPPTRVQVTAAAHDPAYDDRQLGTCASLLQDDEPVTALALSPNCTTLVIASRSLTCRMYNVSTGELIRAWRPHKAPVADMAMDASGGYVATASADRSVKVWDVQGGFCTHSFAGHGGVVLKVLFHPKQLQLYSSSDNGEVRGWHAHARTHVLACMHAHMAWARRRCTAHRAAMALCLLRRNRSAQHAIWTSRMAQDARQGKRRAGGGSQGRPLAGPWPGPVGPLRPHMSCRRAAVRAVRHECRP